MTIYSAQQNLGATLRGIREQRGISQGALALHSGLNRSFISEIECGRANPSLGSLEKLAAALDLKVIDLLASAEGKDGQTNQQQQTSQHS